MTELVYLTDGRRHLICRPYSIENLHRMATDLGIGRHWFHAGDKPHYDVPARRMTEIAARCEIVSSKEIVRTIANASVRSIALGERVIQFIKDCDGAYWSRIKTHFEGSEDVEDVRRLIMRLLDEHRLRFGDGFKFQVTPS